jgi:D-alanine-D-alanine ligase
MNKNNFGKVAVLLGGTSNEREISINSGQSVLKSLKRNGVDAIGIDPKTENLQQLKLFDRVFICLHGKDGEDGKIQKYLDDLKVPYTGNGAIASSLCMNKYLTKKQWVKDNVPTPLFMLVNSLDDYLIIRKYLGDAFILKPASSGSSLGVSIVKNNKDFKEAFNLAVEIDSTIIAEAYINGSEYAIPILNNSPLPIIEIKPKTKFYNFDAKYNRQDTEFICPANLPEDFVKTIQQKSLDAFFSLGCKGYGRVDFMVDGRKNLFFIEVNTIPGFTDHSLMPMSAKTIGKKFDDLVLDILDETCD